MAIKYLNSLNLSKNELQNARIQNLAAAPSSPVEGQIYYDTGDNEMYYYNGSAWQSMAGDITGVTAGSGLTGGGTDGTVTVSIATGGVTNAMLANSSLTVTAGDGLTGGGAISLGGSGTLNIGAGTGITVNANDVALDTTSSRNVDHSSVTLTAGSGLTGGGDISASRTFAVGAGTGIVVNADSIEVKGAGTLNTEAVVKWDAGSGSFVDSLITDDGTTVTVSGNLTVTGTTTTVNTETINLADNIILLNSNETGTPSQDGGIEVERGTSTNVSLIWDESTDRWSFTNDGSTYYNIPISSEYNNYSHPTQSAIDVDTSGVDVIDRIQVNTLGHVTSVTSRTLQSASTSQSGVVELATDAEAIAGSDTARAVTPRALEAHYDSKNFAENVGDGAATAFTVSHNLGTRDVIVQIYDNTTYETVHTDVVRTDANSLEVTFAVAPSTGAYRVLVTSVA